MIVGALLKEDVVNMLLDLRSEIVELSDAPYILREVVTDMVDNKLKELAQ